MALITTTGMSKVYNKILQPFYLSIFCVYSNGVLYWTDYIADAIYRANLSTGLDIEVVVDTHLPEPGQSCSE